MRISIAYLFFLGACSFSTYNEVPCTSNEECRESFGWGNVCQESTGLCAPADDFARCDAAWPTDLLSNRSEYSDAIVYGAILDRSYAPAEMLAFELPFRQVEDNGGLSGVTLGLIECDSQESAAIDDLSYGDATVAAATWLANDIGVPAILGPDSSSTTQATYLEVEPLGALIMSHSATSDALTDLDGNSHTNANPGLLWRTCPPDSLQGSVIAADMQSRGVREVAVIYESGLYGQGLADKFDEDFATDSNHKVTRYEYGDASQLTDAIVSAVASGDIEEVLFISSVGDDIEAFLNGAGVLGAYDGTGIFLTDAAYYTDIFENTASNAGHLFPNVRGSRPTVDTDSSVYSSFAVSFSSTYGVDASNSSFTAHAYDAAWLVMYGSAWSKLQEGKVFGKGIARGLRQMVSGAEVTVQPTSWNTVLADFDQGTSIDVVGASGQLDFDPVDWEVSAPIEVWTVEADGSSYSLVEDYQSEGT